MRETAPPVSWITSMELSISGFLDKKSGLKRRKSATSLFVRDFFLISFISLETNYLNN